MYKELRVIELVRKGLTDNAALAERLGLTKNTVRHYRHKHGLSNQRGPELHNVRAQAYGFPDYPAAIRAWAAEGLTNEAIGARLGVWASQVSLYIRQMGGVARPAGRGRVADNSSYHH